MLSLLRVKAATMTEYCNLKYLFPSSFESEYESGSYVCTHTHLQNVQILLVIVNIENYVVVKQVTGNVGLQNTCSEKFKMYSSRKTSHDKCVNISLVMH